MKTLESDRTCMSRVFFDEHPPVECALLTADGVLIKGSPALAYRLGLGGAETGTLGAACATAQAEGYSELALAEEARPGVLALCRLQGLTERVLALELSPDCPLALRRNFAETLALALAHGPWGENAQTESRALFDALTGLPGRMLLFDRLHHTIAHARRNDELFALLLIDLDRFKEVNERWGQEAGDKVLRIVAERFAVALRSTDSLARVGGDVFAAIAEGLMFGDDVELVVQKLRGALASPISLAGEALHLGATIGLALFPASGEDAEALYRAAETALSQARETHRGGQVIFEPGIGG